MGGRNQQQQTVSTVFNFFRDSQEDEFQLVDNKQGKPVGGQANQSGWGNQQRGNMRQLGGQRQGQQGQQNMQGQRGQQGGQNQRGQQMQQGGQGQRGQQMQQGQRRQQGGQMGYNQGLNQGMRVQYSPSVDIRPEWRVIEEVALGSQLHKLSFNAPEPEDLVTCGSIPFYDKSLDVVTAKMDRPLQRSEGLYNRPTASEDPVIQGLAAGGRQAVFTTDAVLSALMCASRSVYSFDVSINKVGGQLFLDKRDGSSLDHLTASETNTLDPVPEDRESINALPSINLEATIVNQSIAQQALIKGGKPALTLDKPDPFPTSSGPRPALKYRSWTLGSTEVIVRCEVDCALEAGGRTQLVQVRALNETEPRPGMDWKQKLDQQRGTILATEIKNNANKVTKWVTQAILADVDQIKVGYVARLRPRDNVAHTILGMQTIKPKDFAAQINLQMDNNWGLAKALIDLFYRLEDGKYLLLRDPTKPCLRLYHVGTPAGSDE